MVRILRDSFRLGLVGGSLLILGCGADEDSPSSWDIGTSTDAGATQDITGEDDGGADAAAAPRADRLPCRKEIEQANAATDVRFFYDDELRLLREEFDSSDRIGNPDYLVEYQYGEEGLLRREAHDWLSDSLPEDTVFEYESYNDAGDLELFRKHVRTSGRTSVVRLSYEYGEDGQITVRMRDSRDDGTIDGTYEFIYEEGLVVRETYEDDLGGDYKAVYEYDERGNLIVERRDEGGDGSVDWRREYRYDERDRLLEETSYGMSFDYTASYSYACP